MSVSRLSRHRPSSDRKYFIDANVWLLKLESPFELKNNERLYIDFVDEIISSEFSIYTHSLITSEIFNAFMRISFRRYKDSLKHDYQETRSEREIDNLDFKKHYRGTDDYSLNLELFKDEFKSYSDYLHFLDKEAEVDGKYLVGNIPGTGDFNDFFYYELALEQGLTIITHDGDFNFPDIEILTENPNLLRWS